MGKALAEVEKRSKALDLKSKEKRNIKGINDLRPLLDHLVNKVSLNALVKLMITNIYLPGFRENSRFPCCPD